MASHHDRHLMRFRVGKDGVLHIGDVDDQVVVHEPDEPLPPPAPPQSNSPPIPNGF